MILDIVNATLYIYYVNTTIISRSFKTFMILSFEVNSRYFHTSRWAVKKLMRYLMINVSDWHKLDRSVVVGRNEGYDKGVGEYLEYHKFAAVVVQRPR